MEKRMERSLIYNGTITAEQFLFYEIRIASKYYLYRTSVEDAIEEIKKNNLFQYPTERLVARMVRSCYKRLDALDDEQLRQELSSAPPEIAKQINLYAMMRYNRIVWDFMVGVIGEKFRSQDFEFSRKDLNVFFSHLQEQNDDIAGWSESTVNKIIINYQDLQGIGMTEKLALPTLIAMCSIALGKPTLSSLVVLGEISIAGSILKVDELANVLQVCLDSGAKKVLLPITSAADLGLVPADLIGCFNLIFYQSAEDAVYKALGVE